LAFAGVRPVLHLPFSRDPDEPILHDELARLASVMLAEGADGVVALGLASEAWTLTERERDEVLATVAGAVDGRAPIVVGVDGPTTLALDRARRAVRIAGAAGLMVLPPTSARDALALSAHYGRLAGETGVPILVQDSPASTGVSLPIETLAAIRAAEPLVGAVKIEIPGAGGKITAAVEAGLEVVAGWGGLGYLEAVRRGAGGCMPGCDLGPAIAAIDRTARTVGVDAAADAYGAILPLLAYETPSLDLLLLGAKRMLHRRGIFSTDGLRAPGRVLDPHEAATFDAIFTAMERVDVPGTGPATAAPVRAGRAAFDGPGRTASDDPDRPAVAGPDAPTSPLR
jgi:dihydrodipicolinate synthase/N-acetylneuraminate lyase